MDCCDGARQATDAPPFLTVLFFVLFDGTEMNSQEVEEQFVSTRPPVLQDAGGGELHPLPTVQPDSTAAPQPAKIPPSGTRERVTTRTTPALRVVVHCG